MLCKNNIWRFERKKSPFSWKTLNKTKGEFESIKKTGTDSQLKTLYSITGSQENVF